MEIRQNDKQILNDIFGLLPLIEKQFCQNNNYLLVRTKIGLKLQKK